MSEAQSAICRENGGFGLFLTLALTDGGEAVVRRTLAGLPKATAALAEKLGVSTLSSAAAIGAAAWPRLFSAAGPRGLLAFAALSNGGRTAPSTPADLFLHIHSPRHDANFMLARQVMDQLGVSVRLIEEIHGFTHLNGRDLTGFVDGTENAKGDERAEVALVGEENPAFAGGSFVSIQRYVHDMRRWNAVSLPDQEAAVGRTKADDRELPDDVKPPSAHIARVVIEENGKELEILRHSMPYGTTTESGLYFVAYGRSPAPFRKMLKRMIEDDAQGHHDRLLDFTRAVTGASFFAPSVDLLESLG